MLGNRQHMREKELGIIKGNQNIASVFEGIGTKIDRVILHGLLGMDHLRKCDLY
jgi:hypothetical protein